MARLGQLVLLFVAIVVSAAALLPPSAVAQLRTDYYASICPNLETIVHTSIMQSIAQTPIAAPAVLRLFFHDCAVMGCDASIMIQNSNDDDEWHNTANLSLKPEGFQAILSAKAAVDSDQQCQNKVSCADIMALAAREVVSQTHGPYYQVELGRFDGRVSTRDTVRLPGFNFTLDQLNAFFSGLGFSQNEMVALLGAHTLGAAGCPFFQDRLGSNSTMDPTFASQLRSTCSSNPSSGFEFLDPTTPRIFDNAFYQNLQGGRGLLGSDQVLYSDQRSRSAVDNYASNQAAFFTDFVAAITKLGRIGAKTTATGEIRSDCQFPNPTS